VSTGAGVALAVVGIALAVVLWDALAAFGRGVAAEAAVPDGAGLDAFDLVFSGALARHAGSRPFLGSRPLLQEIMDAAEPVADPQGAVNTVRWDVPGRFNGTEGTWELVVNTSQKVVHHFNFVR
jgi:hypothetical protein